MTSYSGAQSRVALFQLTFSAFLASQYVSLCDVVGTLYKGGQCKQHCKYKYLCSKMAFLNFIHWCAMQITLKTESRKITRSVKSGQNC